MSSQSAIGTWMAPALRIVVAAIFIYAGASKAIAPLRFVADVGNFHLLPSPMIPALGLYLPWLEILCGASLLFLRLSRGAVLVLLCLVSVFLIALISARLRGLDVSCGCFGHAAHDLIFAWHLVLNFGIIAALIVLWRFWTGMPTRGDAAERKTN